jgi:hypothetical protein
VRLFMNLFIGSNNNIIKVKCFEWNKYGRLLLELFKYDEKLIESGLVKKYSL